MRHSSLGMFLLVSVGSLTVLAALAAPWTPAQIFPPAPPPVPLPTPRLADGTPNLGPTEPGKGYWVPRQHRDYAEVLVSPDEIPYQPWARALAEYRRARDSKYDPQGRCLPPGGPRMMTTPYPMEILQLPEQGRILMIYEGNAHVFRIVYTDGREHPDRDSMAPTFLGHSTGHWEGDTLVIDTVGFNENAWIDMAGDPRTDRLHLIERLTRTDLHTLRYEATIDDPGAYTEPWTIAFDIHWDPDGQIQEYICQENNRWLESLTDEDGNPIYIRAR